MSWKYFDPPPLFKDAPKEEVPEIPPETPYWLHSETVRFYRAWEPIPSKWKSRAWSWMSILGFIFAAAANSPWIRIPAVLFLVWGLMETCYRRGHYNGFLRGFIGGRMKIRGDD